MNMKYISRILFISALAFGFSACSEPIGVYDPVDDESCEMTVNITSVVSGPATKSKVSGGDTRVHTMQMICFDANGGYLGIRKPTITSNNATPDTGTIKGTVPQGTSRIHFIANRGLPEFLTAAVGTPEAEVMASEELSTKWNDADHQEICYWGYHKEANASAMESWLNPTQGNSKVYLIRDRAKIVLSYDKSGASVPVTKIEWLIHHGLERGYLAPAEASWTNTGYYANSTVSGHEDELISVAGMNVYPGDDRYTLWTSDTENDENNFDETYNTTDGNKYVPQFLFDDSNESIDGLKAILRVTYTVDGSPKTVYHVLKLNDDDKVLYDVVRNNTYYIDVKLLSPDVGFYLTLKDAINGDEFINADIEVDRSITSINDENYTLQILLPTETTSIVFNTTGEQTMDFALRLVENISTSGTDDPADFEIKWEKDQTFCSNDLGLTYNSYTKQFTITATVNEVTDQLKDEWIVVKHKASGLTRYIHVYVIDQFRYLDSPTLVKSGNDYVLSFKIPPTVAPEDNPSAYIYPAGLYPIDVRFTTNTLNAYGYAQSNAIVTDYGAFGVAVEPTLSGDKDLTDSANFETGYATPVSSTANGDRTHWYYQQATNPWDFWYTYSIKSYEQTSNGVVTIYFNDVRDHIKYATVADLGLFMEIKYFGKIYSMPVTN